MKKSKEIWWYVWNTIKWTNVQVIKVPEEAEKDKGPENLF